MIIGSGFIIGGAYADFYEETGNLADEGIEKADENYSYGDIDDPDNLANVPIYIFSGGSDDDVFPEKQEAQRDFFEHYNANVEFVQKADVGHDVPSIFYGDYCEEEDLPEDICTYDTMGALFTHILPNLETGSVSVNTL